MKTETILLNEDQEELVKSKYPYPPGDDDPLFLKIPADISAFKDAAEKLVYNSYIYPLIRSNELSIKTKIGLIELCINRTFARSFVREDGFGNIDEYETKENINHIEEIVNEFYIHFFK